MNKKGFTLVEILMAIGVLAIVISVSTTIYINITREQKRAEIQNSIYEDSRLMLEKITAYAKDYAVDYEEYYSHQVLQKDQDPKTAPYIKYGINYGKYGAMFYDPGLKIPVGGGAPVQADHPEDLGAQCGDGSPMGADSNCVIFIPSLDVNTGKNPYNLQAATDTATAFCKNDCVPGATQNMVQELYLISTDGKTKVIFTLEKTPEGENALSMLEMIGTDTDNNGVADEFLCDKSKGYLCTDANSSDLYDGDNPATQTFMPISSPNVQIKDLKFIITPLEDPRKAFNEGDYQMQPSIVIMMTLTPTAKAATQLRLPDIPEITVQTTITPRVYSEVKSYPPVNDLTEFKKGF